MTVPDRLSNRGDGRPLPGWLVRDLRTDQAGETGAVTIYLGILAVTRDPVLRAFARAHLETERRHLTVMDGLLERRAASRLLPLWRLAGFITGSLPALFGPAPVFATVAAVETFVDRHYASQIRHLEEAGTHADIRRMLERCRQDEADHRDEATGYLAAPPGPLLRLWCRIVHAGSVAAVAASRRF